MGAFPAAQRFNASISASISPLAGETALLGPKVLSKARGGSVTRRTYALTRT
jgi:hypothetical protein